MDKLNQSLDLFTEGLRSDPEIRLDIRKELQSHLEEKIAEETAQGHSSEESLELALKTFGSPVEVADGLAAANRKRMNFRARIRLLAGALLIPTVIICALVSLNMASGLTSLNILFGNKLQFLNTSRIFTADFFRGYTAEQKLILYGDDTRKNRIEQQKAIWDKFPENKVYAANYIIVFLDQSDGKDMNLIVDEIDRVGRFDQENAFYNYIAAGIMLKSACDEVQVPGENSKAKPQYRFELKDRALLEKAMRQYMIGVNKKYCRSYSMDFLKEKLQIMGDPESFIGHIDQIVVAACFLLPNLSQYRNISKYMPEYAGILIKEGKKQEALQYLNTWKQFIRHINSDSDYLITVLVMDAIARIDAEKLPLLYDKLGMTEVARTVAEEAGSIHKPVQEWKNARKQITGNTFSDHGSILSSVLIPALGHEFTGKELAPSRYAEYVFFQKITLAAINLVLLAGMVCAAVAVLFWRVRSNSRLLLLAPQPLAVLKILGMGSVLPYIACLALLQIELLSGYSYGIVANFPKFIAQMTLLMMLITTAVLTLTGRYVTDRCRELGVATPPPSGRIYKISFMTGLGLLVIAAFIPLSMSPPHSPQSPTAAILIIGGLILTVLVILRIGQWTAVLFCGKEYSVYYGAAARMLLLTFALAVLVLTCIFRPILDWREAGYIREDKIMFGSTESFTRIEGDVVRYLKSGIDQALTKVSK